MEKLKRQLAAVKAQLAETTKQAETITGKAASAGRRLESVEKKDLDELLVKAETLREQQAELQAKIQIWEETADVGRKMDDEGSKELVRYESPGQLFVKSEGYKGLISRGLRGSWSSGPVELKALVDSSVVGAEDTGLVQRTVQPGLLNVLEQPPTIADLMASGTTVSPLIRYMVETPGTNGAAAVPEGGEKPESEIGFSAKDESVTKIATFLPVVDEMLEDVAQLASYIDARLTLFVRREEEREILLGDGNDSELLGLIPRVAEDAPDNIMVRSDLTGANDFDHIFHGMTVIRDAFLEPDAMVLHPADWEGMRLNKDGNDRYYGGGPFADPASPSIWGLRVVVTTVMAQGTALVGAFRTGAQIFRKGGITVEASNSHADFFRHNQTAIRAEERLALAVYRPAAFATVDLGAATP